MTQLETDRAGPVDLLLDLSTVSQESRATVWHGAVQQNFPGLSVSVGSTDLPIGRIDRVKLGAGELVAIQSMPAEVQYHPRHVPAVVGRHLSLMLQTEGSTVAKQGEQQCRLQQGDICLLDEGSAFGLLGEECSRILFLRMPRRTVLGRFPQMERQCAMLMPASQIGTRMLGDTLVRLMADAPLLNDLQRAALMSSAIQMLGVAEPVADENGSHQWRVRRAIDFIEMSLSVAGLTAEDVARDQHISRRRLDQLMRAALGRSIASHLWTRRLQQASADLRDPARRAQAVAQIAFANGFEDAGHFTRAFKRAYGVTPSVWRHEARIN